MKLRIRILYGMFSYTIALILLLIPFFSVVDSPAMGRILPFVGGAFLICTSLITDFEAGLLRLMRFSECVACSLSGSLFVIVSGLLFDFGSLLWPILSLAFIQAVISAIALRFHHVKRHRFV